MKSFTNSRKFLFGVSVSMVLAMAIGSFALGENQTPASPQEVEAQSAVGATFGPFTVEGGTQGTDFDYASPVLTIHSGDLTISTNGETAEQIVVDGAATITLEGVNINTSTGPALQIQDNATFDVNILLADGSINILKATASRYAGLQKNGSGDNIGALTIGVPNGSAETGKLEANGGYEGAGIGGGYQGSGSNITITGGVVIATGGMYGAGIGGGYTANGSNIKISGGVVTATGGNSGAGIGGGSGGSGSTITINGGEVTAKGGYSGAGIGGGYTANGSNIKISGGIVTATGGDEGAGIGGGPSGSGSNITITGGEVTATGGTNGAGIGGGVYQSGSNNNSLNGDAVVLATSGDASRAALEGFVDDQGDSLLTQGIAFTRQTTSGTWSSAMYGNVTLSQDLEIPANLTVPAGQILSIKEGKDVTLSEETGVKYTVEGELRNNGIVTLPSDLEVNDEGKVTTAITYDAQDGRIANADEYKTYQDSSEVKAYSELPNAEKDGCVFEGWYTERDGGGTKVEETSLVLLNQHVLYANWTANPEPTPEPSVDPDQGGDGSDASSKTGDSFAGIAALAIIGVATTGAALLRKRK